jgi:PAS domain S-box-containing protein
MLFEASPLPMWVVDTASLRFLGVNEAALRLYGYTREEFLEMRAEALWPSEERAALRYFVRRDEAEVQRGIFRQVKKSGELLYVEGVANLVMWRGRLARLAMLSDVSERVRAREALERLNRELEDRVRSRTAQLEAANRELEAFSYSVSHDLRAPVRHIDGFVKLLERELPAATDKAGHYLRTIANSSRRMGALIDDLLALSRTARTPLETRIVPLNELLDDVLREMSPDTASRRIDWRLGQLPAVHGDASLLRVVLQNLLSNAVKYTRPRGTAVIEVGVERMENGETAVFVRDNGVGFDMLHADRLFGVFQRLHRDEDFEGTGVGLATARRIVHRHGGRIWGEGEPERGATFRFTVNPVPEDA